MADFIFLVVIVGFFVLSAAYVFACDRIVESEHDARDEVTEVTS